MFFTVHRFRGALHLKGRSTRAGCMRATPPANVYHAPLSMFLAVQRCPALDVVVRLFRAIVMRATLGANVHHAVLSMLPAVHTRPAALEVEIWVFDAVLM